MKIIGHRGARGLAPENTIDSLQKAVEHQVDEIEFDLRVTKDKVVILHHNSYLLDGNGDKQPISQLTYQELLTHKSDLATFEAALQMIDQQVPLYVEVKPGEMTAPIVNIIKTYLDKGWRPDNFKLASFNQKTLLELHRALPQLQTIVLEHWSGVRAGRRARQLDTKLLSIDQRWLWSGFIRAVSRSGYQLYTYTLNNPRKAERWAKYGLAGVITDYPDRFEKSHS